MNQTSGFIYFQFTTEVDFRANGGNFRIKI